MSFKSVTEAATHHLHQLGDEVEHLIEQSGDAEVAMAQAQQIDLKTMRETMTDARNYAQDHVGGRIESSVQSGFARQLERIPEGARQSSEISVDAHLSGAASAEAKVKVDIERGKDGFDLTFEGEVGARAEAKLGGGDVSGAIGVVGRVTMHFDSKEEAASALAGITTGGLSAAGVPSVLVEGREHHQRIESAFKGLGQLGAGVYARGNVGFESELRSTGFEASGRALISIDRAKHEVVLEQQFQAKVESVAIAKGENAGVEVKAGFLAQGAESTVTLRTHVSLNHVQLARLERGDASVLRDARVTQDASVVANLVPCPGVRVEVSREIEVHGANDLRRLLSSNNDAASDIRVYSSITGQAEFRVEHLGGVEAKNVLELQLAVARGVSQNSIDASVKQLVADHAGAALTVERARARLSAH